MMLVVKVLYRSLTPEERKSNKSGQFNTYDKVLDVVEMDESDPSYDLIKQTGIKNMGMWQYRDFNLVKKNYLSVIKSRLINPSTTMYEESVQIIREKRLKKLLDE